MKSLVRMPEDICKFIDENSYRGETWGNCLRRLLEVKTELKPKKGRPERFGIGHLLVGESASFKIESKAMYGIIYNTVRRYRMKQGRSHSIEVVGGAIQVTRTS